MQRVLFVCMGNICRSPLAEAILRQQAEKAGVDIEVDSAGTGGWHAGERSDPRAIEVGESRGYPMDHRARQVRNEDFEEFDLIIAMDHANMATLRGWPGVRLDKLHLARSFDPSADSDIIADPYYGPGLEWFEVITDQLEAACAGLLLNLSLK